MSKSFSRTKSLSTSNVLEPADDPVPECMGDRRSTSFSKRALPSSIVGKMDAFHSKHSVGLLDYQEIQEHGAKAVKSFVSSTWMTRILLLFPALHPWLETVRFSLFTSHTTRTALIITKLTSAAAVGALFFSSTSFTSSSDPDCAPPTNLLSQMIQAATVGLLSAFFGDTVIFVLFIIQSRQAVDKNEWKPREKERLLWRWRCKSTLFWLIWSCHAGFCVFYTLAFLANVSAKDAAKWLESCAISLLQDLVLVPLSVALVLATLASLAICCSRHVKHRIENDWFMDEDSEEEDDGSDPIRDSWLAPQDAEEVDEEPNDPMISVHFEEESLHSVQLGADGAVALRVAAHETPSAAPGNAPVGVPDDCTSIHSVVC